MNGICNHLLFGLKGSGACQRISDTAREGKHSTLESNLSGYPKDKAAVKPTNAFIQAARKWAIRNKSEGKYGYISNTLLFSAGKRDNTFAWVYQKDGEDSA